MKTFSLRYAFLLALTLVVSLGVVGQADAAKYSSCEDVMIYQGDGEIYAQTVNLKKKHTSCKIARSVARKWLSEAEGSATTPHPHGYRCKPRTKGMICRKGKRRVSWDWENRVFA